MATGVRLGHRLLALTALLMTSHQSGAAPLQPHVIDDMCAGGGPRLMYITSDVVVVARFPGPSQSSNNSGDASAAPRRHCALDLVTCLNCHLQLSLVDSRYNCGHADHCSCLKLELSEQEGDRSTWCSMEGALSVTSVGRTLNARLAFSELLSGEVRFRVLSKENRRVYGEPSEVIETPRFPAAYPAHYVAEYVIRRPAYRSRSAIRLTFTDFLVSQWSLLEITDDEQRRVGSYSGDIFRPPVTLTNTSELTLRFHANGRPGNGFRAMFDFVAPLPSGAFPPPPRTDCGGVVVGAGGAITMLNMTRTASVWYDCVWMLRPRPIRGRPTSLSVKLNVFKGLLPGSRLTIIEGRTTRGATIALVSTGSGSGESISQEHTVGTDSAIYVHLSAGFTPVSRLALVYSSYRRGACGPHREMACGDGRCIAQFLKCDSFSHCPDGSDEADSCYTYALSTSLGLQNEDTWTLTPANFYFPGPSHTFASLESATLSLLAMCLIIMLTMTSAVIFIYSNGREVERRARRRILQSLTDLMRDGSVEVENAAADDPPEYEAPPDYEDLVQCFPVNRKPRRKRKYEKETQGATRQNKPTLRAQLSTDLLSVALFGSRRHRLPRHNTVPSLHHFGEWLRHQTQRASTAAAAAVPGSASADRQRTPDPAPLVVQLPRLGRHQHGSDDAEVATIQCDCAGACGCAGERDPPASRGRPMPRSQSADVLSSSCGDGPMYQLSVRLPQSRRGSIVSAQRVTVGIVTETGLLQPMREYRRGSFMSDSLVDDDHAWRVRRQSSISVPEIDQDDASGVTNGSDLDEVCVDDGRAKSDFMAYTALGLVGPSVEIPRDVQESTPSLCQQAEPASPTISVEEADRPTGISYSQEQPNTSCSLGLAPNIRRVVSFRFGARSAEDIRVRLSSERRSRSACDDSSLPFSALEPTSLKREEQHPFQTTGHNGSSSMSCVINLPDEDQLTG